MTWLWWRLWDLKCYFLWHYQAILKIPNKSNILSINFQTFTETTPKKSCDELWLSGERTDMKYDIDPDGPDGIGPAFKIFCNLSEGIVIFSSGQFNMVYGPQSL